MMTVGPLVFTQSDRIILIDVPLIGPVPFMIIEILTTIIVMKTFPPTTTLYYPSADAASSVIAAPFIVKNQSLNLRVNGNE